MSDLLDGFQHFSLCINPKNEYSLLVTQIWSLYSYCFLFILLWSGTVVPMLLAVMAVVPAEKLAVHFHDTYGQSLANILVSLQVSQQTIAWTLFACLLIEFIDLLSSLHAIKVLHWCTNHWTIIINGHNTIHKQFLFSIEFRFV